MLLALFPFLIIATYSIPFADEFSSAYYQNKMSIFQFQKLLLQLWSGRYIANFLESVYSFPHNYNIFIGLSLGTISMFIYLGINSFFAYFKHIIANTLLLIALINGFPSITDVFYYSQAIFAYTIAFLAVFISLKIITTQHNPATKITIIAICNILLLGEVELFILPVLCCMIAIWYFVPKYLLPKIIHTIIVLAIIMALVSIHGNKMRYEEQKSTFDILELLKNLLINNFWWAKNYLLSLICIVAVIYTFFDSKRIKLSHLFQRKSLIFVVLYYASSSLFTLIIHLRGYERIGNVLYFLNFLCICYIILYISIHFAFKKSKLLMIVLMAAYFVCILYGNIGTAYYDILTSSSKNYTIALKNRYEFLEKHRNEETVYIKDIPAGKSILKIRDVNFANNTLCLEQYRYYYQIDTIILKKI